MLIPGYRGGNPGELCLWAPEPEVQRALWFLLVSMQIQNINSVVVGLFPRPGVACIRRTLIHWWVYITQGCRQTQCPPQVQTGAAALEGKRYQVIKKLDQSSCFICMEFLLYKKIINICWGTDCTWCIRLHIIKALQIKQSFLDRSVYVQTWEWFVQK